VTISSKMRGTPNRRVTSRTPGEKRPVRYDQPLERLHDDGGQALVMRGDDRFRLREVVEGGDEHLFADGVRDARGVRVGAGKALGTRGPTLMSE
jgi:hypothetical protein